VRPSDATVPRFNPPAERARTVGFRKRDSARTVGFRNRLILGFWLTRRTGILGFRVTTGRREKWREKDKTTVGWRAFEVLKPRSWDPGPEKSDGKKKSDGERREKWREKEKWRWTQRKVTGKYRGPETQVLRSRSWEKWREKKSDGGRREKWREKDKTTVGWRVFEVLKPRSWYPTSRWGPETQVLRACVINWLKQLTGTH
jgi:hypothetical protein